MNLLVYFEYFLQFLQHDFFDGLYVALTAFAVLGALFGIFGRKRYIHV